MYAYGALRVSTTVSASLASIESMYASAER